MSLLISLIICTYSRAESLSETLDSIESVNIVGEFRWEVIVVDNNPDDFTLSVIERHANRGILTLRYVTETRKGLSYARNTGIGASLGDILVFTDDDVTVDRDWLLNLWLAFTKFDCDCVGGRIRAVWPGAKPRWFREEGPMASPKAIVQFDLGDEIVVPTECPYGANMAFRREVFDVYGLFRVDLGRVGTALTGGEDIEFFERIRKGGGKILYFPNVIVNHPVTPDRMQKRYFERWCFNAARTAVRHEGLPERATYYFGVPRYYFRDCGSNLSQYVFTLDPDRRFYYKLQLCILAGRVFETKLMNRPALLRERF